jgi:hypothetical protein
MGPVEATGHILALKIGTPKNIKKPWVINHYQ